ncbi:hypothetical protein DSO57_1030009 [Entomophthora muscae]|uniref:Uncharacterized protein n=1 Tax=Entomophthora muscae TaxID=34485 RepID=A0ACC2TNG5_9FUNG|nr:hypothetical protein DSO57_1030009 [Entomophthora muscae]
MYDPKVILQRIGNFLLFVIVLVVNALGAVLPLGGKPVGEGKDSVLLPATPAFSIWSGIYLLQFIFIVYQLFPGTFNLRYINEGITPLYGLQAVGNAGWMFAQAYAPEDSPWVQVIFMYILLLSLVGMYIKTFLIVRKDLLENEGSDSHFYLNFVFGRMWLSLYLSWVAAAACVDSFHAFEDFSEEAFIKGAIVFGVIGIVALAVLVLTQDVVFGLGVVWTAGWLALANSEVDPARPNGALFISAVAIGPAVLAATLLALVYNTLYCFKRQRDARESAILLANEIDV